MDQRVPSEPYDDPLERLRSELSRLRSTRGEDVDRDAVVSRVLEALRQIGEALQPLTRGGLGAPPPPAGPVLAFRRRSREADQGEAKGPVVLVIEPEPSVNDYIHGILLRNGFEPISFSNAEEAVDRALESPPDAVTIDQLVLRHGKENWLVRFKTDPRLARVPLVLVRAPDEDDPVHPFGIAAEVTKPIVDQELVRVLDALCRPGDAIEGAPATTDDGPPPGPRVVRG